MTQEIQRIEPEVEQFLAMAKDWAGSALTATITFLAAEAGKGAVAMFLGGAAGMMIASGAHMMLKDLLGRQMSSRERLKVSVSTVIAIGGIAEDLRQGRQLRNDNFFDRVDIGRSPADEILEGVLVRCQRENQEKKIRFTSNIYREGCFDTALSPGFLNGILRMADQFTYEQFCILKLFAEHDRKNPKNLRAADYRGEENISDEILSLLKQAFDLYSVGLVVMDIPGNDEHTEAILGMFDVAPARMRLSKFGRRFAQVLRLGEVEAADVESVAIQFR